MTKTALFNGSKAMAEDNVMKGVAIALQKNHPAALAYAKDFIERAKANSVVRRAFDDAGLNTLSIAVPSP